MAYISSHKGYDLMCPSSGGKAGKGKAVTSTIQVYKRMGSAGYLEKQIRFTIDKDGSGDNKNAAIEKAKTWIDNHVKDAESI